MGAEALLHAAVINNARWCDAVCRSHGYPGEFGGRLWISAGHALPFYPNAITLSPDVTASEGTASQDPARPFAIKDSFARLDLAPHGLTPLFDAGRPGLRHPSLPPGRQLGRRGYHLHDRRGNRNFERVQNRDRRS